MTARSQSCKAVTLLVLLAACEAAITGSPADSVGSPLVSVDAESCARVLEAKAEVRDVPGGVVLELRSPGTALDVVSLRD